MVINCDCLLLAHNSFHAPGGSIYIGGKQLILKPYLLLGKWNSVAAFPINGITFCNQQANHIAM
jgi:hypothetical protein